MSEYQQQQDQEQAAERREDERSKLADLDPQEQGDNVAGGKPKGAVEPTTGRQS